MILLQMFHKEEEKVCNQKGNNDSVSVILEFELIHRCKIRHGFLWRLINFILFMLFLVFRLLGVFFSATALSNHYFFFRFEEIEAEMSRLKFVLQKELLMVK